MSSSSKTPFLHLITLGIIAVLTFTACAPSVENDEKTAVWPNAVSYEVFVKAFADGSGDGLGDLKGLTSKLDYLQDLGVQSLWLMPIHPSPSYHKYNVTDYRGIHPEYGTMEDFEVFLAEAHRRDIRVVIDLVINHSGREHPWFQAALADSTSPFFDFYIWKRGDEIEDMYVTETGPDSDNLRRWNPVDAYENLYYYAYFWGGMPDLNYDNRAVRDSIYDIGRFWLEKGVDGFRLDAAKHIFPEDRAEDIHAFWEEFRYEMEKVNPDVLLVGEVWAPTEEVKPYLNGLRSLFNFDLGYAIMDAVRTGNGRGLASEHARILSAYATVTDDFIDATFLTNHDQNRVMSELRDLNKARSAASILLTLPGAPYIYYGEEIGMYGSKPDPNIREPMLWQPSPDPMRSRWRENRHSTEENVVPVSVQLENPNSLLHHYRTLIHLRNQTPALTYGALEPEDGLHDALVAFQRRHRHGSVLVLHNVSAEAVTVTLPAHLVEYTSRIWADQDVALGSLPEVTLSPHASVILATE